MKGRHRLVLCLVMIVGICLWSAGPVRGAGPKRGGTLTITWAGGDNAVWMKGPARSVFEGTIEI